MTDSAPTPRRIAGFGWKKDLPDFRDLRFSEPMPTTDLPTSVDLRTSPNMPGVWDQGQLGSCTAHGTSAAIFFERRKQGLFDLMPSRLFLYYGTRALEHDTRYDAGGQIRDAIKVAAKSGVPDESLWPYDASKFAKRPPKTAYVEARKHRATQYESVPQTQNAIKAALAAGSLVVFGFTCYESLESAKTAKTGIIPDPQPNEQVIGGHCVAMAGYDGGTVTIRNSWGGWGDAGYGHMSWSYVLNSRLASDFWIIRMEEAS